MSDTNERSVASAGSVAGDRDILARLRDWRSVHLARLHEVMSEAADEIERLRALADKRGTIAVNRRREIERLRPTDAERAAVEWAISAARNVQHPADEPLRGLLERTK